MLYIKNIEKETNELYYAFFSKRAYADRCEAYFSAASDLAKEVEQKEFIKILDRAWSSIRKRLAEEKAETSNFGVIAGQTY